MPRVKKEKIVEPKKIIESVSIEVKVESNPNVKVIELNGKRYNEIYNPLEGTTRLELLIE